MEKTKIKGGAVQGALNRAVNRACYYCGLEGVDRPGIGFSERCGAHYYRPALTRAVQSTGLYSEISTER